jgi:hypothetical protein
VREASWDWCDASNSIEITRFSENEAQLYAGEAPRHGGWDEIRERMPSLAADEASGAVREASRHPGEARRTNSKLQPASGTRSHWFFCDI